MVMNMRKTEYKKNELYRIVIILTLTVGCIVLYTAMQNKKMSERQSHDPAQEQIREIGTDQSDLQPVNDILMQEKTKQDLTDTESIPASEADLTEGQTFRLAVTDGYLQVYMIETGKLYMETAIAYDLLPARVQTQINEGKYFESEEELLEFLENYSS